MRYLLMLPLLATVAHAQVDTDLAICYGMGSLSIEQGSGYTPGTYQLPLEGGSGYEGTARIHVDASGKVDDVAAEAGKAYVVGDVLTARIPGGFGFKLTVGAVHSYWTKGNPKLDNDPCSTR